MGFFSKKKKDEEFKKQLEREALDKMNNDFDFTLPFERSDNIGIGYSHHENKAPNVLTPEELMGTEKSSDNQNEKTAVIMESSTPVKTDKINMKPKNENISSSEFLYKKMIDARKKVTESSIQTSEPVTSSNAGNVAPSPDENKVRHIFTADSMKNKLSDNVKSNIKTEQEKEVTDFSDNSGIINNLGKNIDNIKTANASKINDRIKSEDNDSAPVQKNSFKSENVNIINTKEDKKQEVQRPFDLNLAINELKASAGLSGERIKATVTHNNDVDQIDVSVIHDNSSKQPKKVENNNIVEKIKPVVPDNKQIKSEIDDDVSRKIVHDEITAASEAEKRRKTLLDRCNAYLDDDKAGTVNVNNTEKYKLESVESILKDFENRAAKSVMKKLNVSTYVDESGDKTKTVSLRDNPTQSENDTVTDIFSDISKLTQTPPETTVKHISFNGENAESGNSDTLGNTKHIKLNVSKIQMKPDEHSSDSATRMFNKISDSQVNTPDVSQNESEQDDKLSENEYTGDYKTVGDREAVLETLLSGRKKLRIRVFGNIILLIISLLTITVLSPSLKAMGTIVYFGINAVISFLALIINTNVIKSFSSFFHKIPDIDISSAVCSIAVLVHSIILIIFGNIDTSYPLASVALLSLLFNNIGKLNIKKRIIGNFDQIADDDIKTAVSVIKNKSVNTAMGQKSVGNDVAVCCGSKTRNIENFLLNSYCKDPVIDRTEKTAKVGLIMALGLGIASFIISSMNIESALFIMAVVFCITASPSTLLISNLPLKLAAKRLNCYGAMLTGYKACNELDRSNAVAVKENQLFPEGTVRMIDMRILSPNAIDRSLLDAYAVAKQIGSPLAGMFKQINNTTDVKPKKADTVVYEDKMGISGWVDNHRIFIGNRIMMEAHGFHSLPPIDLDKKILRKGYFPVYLACENVPCAIFVVKYVPDDEICYELRRLCNTGSTVLVKNCDPNISDEMLSDYFGLYEGSISVMTKQGSDSYDIVTSYKESVSSGASFKNSVCGLFAAVTAAINIKNLIGIMAALYVITVIFGILAGATLMFLSLSAYLSPIYLLLYQLISTIIICLPSFIKRP